MLMYYNKSTICTSKLMFYIIRVSFVLPNKCSIIRVSFNCTQFELIPFTSFKCKNLIFSDLDILQSKVVWLLLSTDNDLRKSQFSHSWEVHGSQAVHELQYKPGLAEIFLFPFPFTLITV